MRKFLNIYSLAAILLLTLFCSSNTLHSQDEKRIAGYLNKFKRGAYKEKLDSIVSQMTREDTLVNTHKYEYSLDFNDTILTANFTNYFWDDSLWSYYESGSRKFDSLDRLISNETANFRSRVKEPYKKNIYTYLDNSLNLLSNITYNWSTDLKEWKWNQSDEYFYNKNFNNRLDSMKTVNDYGGYYRLYNFYNESSNIDSVLTFDNLKLFGEVVEKIDREFDNSKRIVSITNSRKDKFTDKWMLLSKRKFEYKNKFDTIEIYQTWNSNTREWENRDKVTKSYNDNGILINKLNETFFNSNWNSSSKIDYHYNNQSQLINYSTYIWDKTINAFVKTYQIDDDYDTYQNIINSKHYNFEVSDSNHKVRIYNYDYSKDSSNTFLNGYPYKYNTLLSIIDSLEIDSNMMIFEKFTYYYSPVIYTSVENNDPEVHSLIYPNPANTEISIESKDLINSIEIYDMLGNLKQSKSNFSQNDNKLDIQSLMSGVYVVKILGSNFTKNELLTIQR